MAIARARRTLEREEGFVRRTAPRRAAIWSRVNLRTRVVAIGLVASALSGVVIVSARASVHHLTRTDEAIAGIADAQRYHQDADMMHDALRADVFDALLVTAGGADSETIVRDQLSHHVDQFLRDLVRIQSLALPTPLRDALEHVRTSLVTYIGSAEQISEMAFVDRHAASLALPAFEQAFDELATAQDKVTIELTHARTATAQHVEGNERAAQSHILVASVFALGGLIALVLLLVRLARPIRELAVSAERLGAGDFSVRTPITGIPEVDSVANALNTTAERLGEIISRERAFSADASHQLRTPLTGIRLRLEHMAENDPGVHAAEIGDVIALVDRMGSTVEGLLALARENPVKREPLDVQQLLEVTASNWRPRLAQLERAIRIDCDHDLPTVAASEVAVSQILEVLTSNAVEHGAGSVTLRARDTGGGVSIEVEDEGDGITGNSERVFARRADRSQGKGIGLALARSLALAEGGRLVLARNAPKPVFALILLAVRN